MATPRHAHLCHSTTASRWIAVLLGALALGLGLTNPQVSRAWDGNEYDGQNYDNGEIVVNLIEGYAIEDFVADYERYDVVLLDAFPEANLYLVETSVDIVDDIVTEFCDDPRIEFAEANYYQESPEATRQMVLAAIGGTMADYEDQELTHRIHLDEGHQYSRGEGTVIAVLDTGVDADHEALRGAVLDYGWDFVDNDDDPSEEKDGIDQDHDGYADGGYGHGTMVAGIVSLVAPGAYILPIRVLDTEGCSDVFRVCKAIRYALLAGADVINMSFGAPYTINAIGHQLWWAYGYNATVVCGAGNFGEEDPPLFPAAHETAIMVASVDSNDVKCDFSDWNCKVLVSAPGEGVRSAYPDDKWAIGAGCSFAAPFISGEVALIKSLRPDLEAEAIAYRIGSGTDDLYWHSENKPYWGKLGWGRVNLEWALCGLESAVGSPLAAPAARLTVSPNPSRGEVTLRLANPTPGEASDPLLEVSIFDPNGRRVRRLDLRPGSPLRWDARDEFGRSVATGTYFARAGRSGPAARIQILR